MGKIRRTRQYLKIRASIGNIGVRKQSNIKITEIEILESYSKFSGNSNLVEDPMTQ